MGLPGAGLSWSAEHSLDRPAAIPAAPAAGLPNSRRLRPGQLDALKPSLLGVLLQELESTPLPPLGRASNTGATAINTYLRRRPIWRKLREEAAAKGEQLTCCSFRHGYQVRHSLQTHLRHSCRWCDAQTAMTTMGRALAKVTERQPQSA